MGVKTINLNSVPSSMLPASYKDETRVKSKKVARLNLNCNWQQTAGYISCQARY